MGLEARISMCQSFRNCMSENYIHLSLYILYIYIYVRGVRCLRPAPRARRYGSQIPGLLLLLAAALTAAMAAALPACTAAAAAGWLAGAWPYFIDRNV